MKIKLLFITIIIASLSVGGYFLYDRYFSARHVDVWRVIPASAIAVYETPNCENCKTNINTVPPIVKLIIDGLYVDSVAEKNREIIKKIIQYATVYSMHKITNHSYSFMYYVPKKRSKELFSVIDNDIKLFSGKKNSRVFSEVSINEITFSEGGGIAWVDVGDYIVVSAFSLLIEDTIRRLKDNNPVLTEKLKGTYTMPFAKNNSDNIYIQLDNMVEFIGLFFDNNTGMKTSIGGTAVVNAKVQQESVSLSGFINIDSTSNNKLFQLFANQKPMSFELKEVISDEVMYLSWYGISDGAAFGKRLRDNPNRNNRIDSIGAEIKKMGIDTDLLYANIQGEVGVLNFDAPATENRVLIVQTKKNTKWIESLEKLTRDDHTESFSDYTIKRIEISYFADVLFSPLITGFDESFYTVIGDHVIIAENIDILKSLLKDIDQENTWGKSVAINRQLQNILLESNIGFYINPSKLNIASLGMIKKEWLSFFQKKKKTIRSFDLLTLQISHLSGAFYTTINLPYNQKDEDIGYENTTASTNTEAGVSSIIHAYQESNKKNSTLFQDSLNTLYYLTDGANIAWKDKLSGIISGDIEQIDFFKNGKKQYVALAPPKLYIYDRLGNAVGTYPHTLNFEAQQMSLIDYDNSRNYRFLFSNKSGTLWMTDKHGYVLQGWNGIETGGELLFKPRHHRVAGRDYIIALRKDGTLCAYNRRGETIKGFPVKVNQQPRGDYYVQKKRSDKDSHIIIITKEGYRVSIDFTGNIVSREALTKVEVKSDFWMEEEQSGKSYIIVRQGSKQLTLLDSKMKERVVNDFTGTNPVDVCYYNFGLGADMFSIVDKEQELAFVYDGQGNMLTSTPLQANRISLQWDGKNLNITTAFRKKISLFTIPTQF